MKEKQNSNEIAFSQVELLAVIGVIAILILVELPLQARTSPKSLRSTCANNLRQIALAFRLWESDNGNHFPQNYAGNTQYAAINSSNGVSGGSAWPTYYSACPNMYTVFEVMSNELNNPRVMVCPADERVAATNFTTDFYLGSRNTRVSYFVGRDTSETLPRMFLAGDRNIGSDTGQSPTSIGGSYSLFGTVAPAAAPGYIAFMGTNLHAVPLDVIFFGWNIKTHVSAGNVATADGSVQLLNTPALISAFVHSGDTNSPGNVLLFP